MEKKLSKYFSHVAAKRLSDVEVDPDISNQHEFNGVSDFKDMFGPARLHLEGEFILLNDDPEQIITESVELTWYDARERNPYRTEYRLYYKTNEVITQSNPGDLIVIGKQSDNKLTILIAPEGSSSEHQLLWLFNISLLSERFNVKNILLTDTELNYAGKTILKLIGIESFSEDTDHLEEMLHIFKGGFPSTVRFSEYARSKVKDVTPVETPDATLIKWLEKEEALFRTLEKHLVTNQLKEGFKDNVDLFIKFSLSVHNRRKSRAGHSFEHHLNALFEFNGLDYTKGARTERNNKPDFLFPGIDMYQNPEFPDEELTMLGVKTTVKDRWRQILSEADRIRVKHLITLEPAISMNQTNEMFEQNVQLVIPEPIMETYSDEQRMKIWNVSEFINYLKG